MLVPVLWLLYRSRAHRSGLARLGVGAVVPVLGAAALTDPAGFLFWTVTGSGAYASFTGSELHVWARVLTNTAILGVACAGLIPPVVRVLRTATRTGSVDLWLRLWLGSSAPAVALGFHFFGHYHLQLVSPVVLLGTSALRNPPGERWARALLVSGC